MGTSREQGLLVGIQQCLEGFHRGCVDYLSWQFVPKWDSPNSKSVLATAILTSLLVEQPVHCKGRTQVVFGQKFIPFRRTPDSGPF